MKYGRKLVVCVLSALMLLALLPAAQAEDGVKTEYRQMEVRRGTVAVDTKVNVRTKPDASSDRAGRLNVGESCVITGESGDWWQVEFEGKTCYVLKELLDVKTVIEEVEVIIEDPLEATLSGLKTPTLLQYRNEYKIDGTIKSNIPLVRVSVEVYNVRTFSVDRSAYAEMNRKQNVREFDLGDLAGKISFRKLEPGEKRLIVRAESTSESVVLSDTFFYVYTDGDNYTESTHMTDACRIRVPRSDEDNLLDRNYTSGIELRTADESITVTLPEGRTAEGMTLCWVTAPKRVTVEMLDGNGLLLETIEDENSEGMIHFYYDLNADTEKIRISTDEKCKLCELRVYEADYVSPVVQQWKAMPEKLDLLVISAHQDDEMLFFGGTIPYYAAQGRNVGVVYMAECSRNRYSEALDGLWSCGLEYHPIFIGFEDKRIDSYDSTVKLWGMTTTENTLVDIIRRYQPEVIVTHDVDGEYGHNQHKVTCAAVRSAVTKSGDPDISPASAQEYGLWTPKKLYIHLFKENPIFMSVYDEPVDDLDGMTMTEVATIGYSKHVSQQDYFSMEKHGVQYDNRKYGLAFTTVGQDVEKNDFFENID